MLMFAMFAWIACAILTACVASSKGRNPIGWLFIGILGGIFALLAVGFMPAKEDGSTTLNLPNITGRIIKDASTAGKEGENKIVCRYCGRDVEPVDEEEKPQEKPHVVWPRPNVWPYPHGWAECADHKRRRLS